MKSTRKLYRYEIENGLGAWYAYNKSLNIANSLLGISDWDLLNQTLGDEWENDFDRLCGKLYFPSTVYKNHPAAKSYFTARGHRVFQDLILGWDTIIKEIQNRLRTKGIENHPIMAWNITKIIVSYDEIKAKILYEDNYQILVS